MLKSDFGITGNVKNGNFGSPSSNHLTLKVLLMTSPGATFPAF